MDASVSRAAPLGDTSFRAAPPSSSVEAPRRDNFAWIRNVTALGSTSGIDAILFASRRPIWSIAMSRGHSILAAALFLAFVSFVCAAEPPIDLGSKRELFVDGYLIAKLTNARLELACLRDEGTVLKFEQPWEGAFCGYCTVIRDGGLFRLYYRGMPSSGSDGSAAECTCYAESKDGIRWIKPALRLFEKNGTRANNVVLSNAEPVTHNFCPFLDARPGVSLSERYKALGGTANSGLIAYVSGDGIHWKKLRNQPAFKAEGWVFDSQNVAFWSTAEGFYVLYFRKAAGGKRAIARATSPDFVRWSEPAAMIYSDTGTEVPSQHLYTNQTQPYFRARHIYIATAARFMPGRKVVSDREASRLGVHPGYFGDTSDAVLMTSRVETATTAHFWKAFCARESAWRTGSRVRITRP